MFCVSGMHLGAQVAVEILSTKLTHLFSGEDDCLHLEASNIINLSELARWNQYLITWSWRSWGSWEGPLRTRLARPAPLENGDQVGSHGGAKEQSHDQGNLSLEGSVPQFQAWAEEWQGYEEDHRSMEHSKPVTSPTALVPRHSSPHSALPPVFAEMAFAVNDKVLG